MVRHPLDRLVSCLYTAADLGHITEKSLCFRAEQKVSVNRVMMVTGQGQVLMWKVVLSVKLVYLPLLKLEREFILLPSDFPINEKIL